VTTNPRRPPVKRAPRIVTENGGRNPAQYVGTRRTFRVDPPRLRTTADPDEQRHATWFELFFDLVFVAAVSQLGSALALHPSVPVFGRFAGLFIVVVWAWVLYTLYANRFDTDDLIFRLAKSGAMLAIAGIAVNLHQAMAGHGGTAGLAGGYVVLRSLLVGLYVRARQHVAGHGRRLTETYTVGYSATTVLWLVSIFVPSPFRYELWASAMLIDLAIPPRAWAALQAHSVVPSHLTERFGTFFIIVLGESVVAAVAGVAVFEFTFESWIVAGLGFVISLCLWWVYFDLADTSVVGRGVLGLIFVYGHFPLLAGVAAFGVGTRLAIVEAAHTGLAAGTRWALAGGIGTFALSLAVLHIGAESTSMHDHTFLGRIGLAALMFILAAAGAQLPPIAFVLIVAVAVLGQLVLEAFAEHARAVRIAAPVTEQPRDATASQTLSHNPAPEEA
jgi:low temperature requirement protein LtrA